MCRMIFAAGKFDIIKLINDFVQIAFDENEKHEENAQVEFKHSDGWGLTFLDGNELKIFRSIKPVYEDQQLEQFKNLSTNLLVLHARKASRGILKLENIHPFDYVKQNQLFVFFHNGTVRDDLEIDPNMPIKGETDSEKFFLYLLSGNNGEMNLSWLNNRILKLTNFSGANFILTNGKVTYLCNWYTLNPLYYTMKILQEKDYVFVSSEKLPHYPKAAWRHLKNQSLFSISTADLNIQR